LYDFIEGDIQSPLAYSYSPSLFNQPKHLELQDKKGWRSFYIIAESTQILGAIHFHIDGDRATSPLRAPFGGIEFHKDVPQEIVYQFIQYFNDRLKATGIKTVTIKSTAEIFTSHAGAVKVYLINQGYIIQTAELSSVIEVNTKTLTEKFHKSERRRFDKALSAGLNFVQLPIGELRTVYSFIKNCRDNKQFALSMPFEKLDETVGAFDGRFLLFGIFDGKRLVSASIAISVTDNVLYEFYHDHHVDYDHLSPVVMLVSGIYDYCVSEQIKYFDLGTSSINNQPNFSLLHFKTLLGATTSPKLTFEKILQ
jgi:lipid II:glycine glycyltransferase (peptidoglycan interpeptide bridge formation enzyme)